MSAETGNADALQIGEWRLDPLRNELSRGGRSVRLEPKAIEVLIYLARRPGRVVGREELLSAIWPGVIVGDDALTQAVIKLRKALEDDVRAPAYIETISKRGYRLIAPVDGANAPAAPEPGAAPPSRRRLAIVSGLAAIAAAALVLWWPWSTRDGSAVTSFPVIAVLPFASQSDDPQRTYLSDGITEDIIHALGLVSGIRVIARNSVETFRGPRAAPQVVRTELGARYVVSGAVREAGGTLRIAVELSDAEQGVLLWSERYEGEARDVFLFQDRMVKSIAGRLAIKLSRLEETRVAAKPVDSMEAYELVLRARSLLARADRRSNREARELLLRAASLSPAYAELYVALSAAEHQRVIHGWLEHVDDGLQRAEDSAKRALALDDAGAAARANGTLAQIYGVRGDFDAALAAATRAIEINPSDTRALFGRGAVLLFLGKLDDAIAALETARRFDPLLLPADAGNVINAFYAAGRFQEALAAAETYLARYPDVAYLHVSRTAALAQLGRVDEARHSADAVRKLDPLFRVEDWGTRFKDPAHAARFQEGLRKAGL